MRKSVGIITTHRTYNFGSFLQAYALQHILELLGYDCEYIDYIPFSSQTLSRYDAPVYSRYIWHCFLRDILHGRWRLVLEDIAKFRWEKMIRKRLHLTNHIFSTIDELTNNCPQYDYYIVGSDQVWNEKFSNNDPAFFLSFAPNWGRKISYASSIANKHWSDSFRHSIKKNLVSFHSISCREEVNAKELEKELKRKVTAVLDPVLLLSAKEWQCLTGLESTGHKRPIIFFFFLDYMQDFRSEALSILDDTVRHNPALSVISNIPLPREYARTIEFTTPEAFLKTVNDSQLLISDSFHAITFALLFNSSVIRVDTKKKERDVRIDDLCHRIAIENDNIYVLDHEKLVAEKNKSLNYLRQAFND